MDPLTHSLLGASLGYATFGRRLGRRAAAVGALAALVPDADVFIRSRADPLLAIEYHRHFTHALLFAPVGAAVIAALGCLRPAGRARTSWRTVWACATLAYLSHCLLDAATSYGTQLLWPLNDRRFGWDVVSVIDPAVTLPLAIGVAAMLLRRSATPALVALLVTFAYLGGGLVQHTRAVRAQQQLAASRGHAPGRFEVMPTFANNVVWRALYLHEGRIHSDRIRVGWFSGATFRPGWSLPQVALADLTPAEAARNRQRSFERFAWFSEGWVARSPDQPAVLADMRYSLSSEAFDPIWGIRFTTGTVGAGVEWINRSRDRRIDPGEVWREIAGHDHRYRPLSSAPPPAFQP